MGGVKNFFSELKRYPSAIFGMIVVIFLVALAVYAVVKIPYSEAIRMWRGGEAVWYQNPKNAPPAWMNAFLDVKKPVSFQVQSGTDAFTKEVIPGEQNTTTFKFETKFKVDYDEYPQEMILYIKSKYETKNPFLSIHMITPDGRDLRIGDFGTSPTQTYRFSQDEKLQRRLKGEPVMQGLFSIPDSDPPKMQKGEYTLQITGTSFEPNSDVDMELVVHGQLYGLFGTDHMRRDLMVPMLWGAPIALAFGFLAAIGTSVLTMIIAAVGAWYGGWVDELIQRITEVNLVLPFLAILIMVGTFYSKSIWTILAVTIALSIFTGGIKTYRAIFMQIKESTYIEAAKAYGASNSRIVFQYMIPRIIPLLLPTLVSAIPAYVFLEASLAVLGLGDPVLPTWGKVINEAWANGALYKGQYYWILQPAVLLIFTGLGFAMLGFALDRIFNPRLRGM